MVLLVKDFTIDAASFPEDCWGIRYPIELLNSSQYVVCVCLLNAEVGVIYEVLIVRIDI